MRSKMNYFLWIISIILLIFTLFTCDDPTAVLQTFTLTLQVNDEDRGTTNPEDTVKANNGKPLSISAIPSSGYEFNEWEIISGDGVTLGSENSLNTTVTLTKGNAIIMANFSLIGAPYGYSVEINPDVLNFTDNTLSFTFTHNNWLGGEEIYHYSIDDDNDVITAAVEGSGAVVGTEQTVAGIDISTLNDGLLSLSFHISAAGIDGNNENDTVTKDTESPNFVSVDVSDEDIFYKDGETITFTVNLVELGLDTLTADLSVLDSTASTTYPLSNSGGNNYTCSFFVNDATAIEDTHSITFTATDYMGNIETDSSLSVTLDFTAPTGTFYIDGTDDPADEYTLTTDVDLNSTITGATQMQFSNTSSVVDEEDWEDYSGTKEWTLSSGVDEKTVYGAFRDTAGNILSTTDTIFYIKKLAASDGATSEAFGTSVSISNDGSSVVVGAPGYSPGGAAYGYNGIAWGTETSLLYSGAVAGDLVGNSVAVSSDGSTVISGAYGDDAYQGSFLIYYDTNWGSILRKVLSPRTDADYLGYSVSASSDGDILVAGAYGKDTNRGAVYIYSGGSPWAPDTTLTKSVRADGDQFGYSVAISSDASTIAVSAYGDNGGAGSVYVYNGSNWGNLAATLTVSGGAAGDSFGDSVAISSDGSTIVVGAHGVNSAKGAAYVFYGANWSQMITLSSGESGDWFGTSVSVSANGQIIAVGAPHEDGVGNTLTFAGAAYVYNGTNWGFETIHRAYDATTIDYFGHSVAISGDGNTIVIGAKNADGLVAGSSSGAAYVYPALDSME